MTKKILLFVLLISATATQAQVIKLGGLQLITVPTTNPNQMSTYEFEPTLPNTGANVVFGSNQLTNLGIGVPVPTAKLDVLGSIKFRDLGNSESEFRIVMTTPDGYLFSVNANDMLQSAYEAGKKDATKDLEERIQRLETALSLPALAIASKKQKEPWPYPNPFTTEINVASDTEEERSVAVININGEKIFSQIFKKGEEISVKTESWPKNIPYLILVNKKAFTAWKE